MDIKGLIRLGQMGFWDYSNVNSLCLFSGCFFSAIVLFRGYLPKHTFALYMHCPGWW